MPFPITCAACHKTFSIADDVFERKVKGRVVTIKCKQCQSGIRVDGTKDKPVFSVADSVRPPPVAPAGGSPAAATPAGANAAAIAVSQPVAAPTVAKVAAAAGAAKAAQPTAAATAPKASTLAKAAPVAIAQKAAAAAAVTSKASATPLAVKAALGVGASKVASAAQSPKAASATPMAKPAVVATAPKAQLAVATKTVQRAPLASAGLGSKPNAVTPKAPAVAPAVAPAPEPPAPEPTVVAPAPEPTAPLATVEPKPLAAVEPQTAPAGTPAENLWAVDYPDGEDRELTLREIEKELAAGTINLSTLVWREGMPEWLELGQLPELSALLAAAVPPASPDLPLPPPPRAQAPSASAVDTSLSVTLPQPTLPLPPQRAPAPSAPVIDFADREAHKAAPPPPIPKPSPTFSTGRDSRPPTPPAFAAGVPTIPSNPVPAFPGAPVAAPLAGALPANASAAAPVANVEDWPQKSRAPWLIGGIALLALGGLIFFLTRTSADELPPPVAISALPPSVPSTPDTPRHVTDQEPTPAADSTASAQASPGSNAALQAPSNGPVASPNAGFAELFASGARGADEKNGVSGPGQRFDPVAAKAALAAVANKTAECREKGGPTGNATVVVTFEPTGKVASSTVSDPPFAGTSSGACIAGIMKLATVRAFSGLPGTVTKVISIQ